MARHGSLLAAITCVFVAGAASAAPETPVASAFHAMLPLPEPGVGLLILAALAVGFWRGRDPVTRGRR